MSYQSTGMKKEKIKKIVLGSFIARQTKKFLSTEKIETMALNLGVFRLCIYDKASGKLFVVLFVVLFIVNYF